MSSEDSYRQIMNALPNKFPFSKEQKKVLDKEKKEHTAYQFRKHSILQQASQKIM